MSANHLTAFLGCLQDDRRLTPFHISLYLALLLRWREAGFVASFPITRQDLQPTSRIGSTHTLYRCLSDLHQWGYIGYAASRSPRVASTVSVTTLTSKPSKPSKKSKEPPHEKHVIPPPEPLVCAYFQAAGHSDMEARKFFNHFQSNGWRVGGKSPMRDWHAAANSWMLNSGSFIRQPIQQTLSLGPGKSYSEPL